MGHTHKYATMCVHVEVRDNSGVSSWLPGSHLSKCIHPLNQLDGLPIFPNHKAPKSKPKR